jgi:uncharacterized protein YxjI
VSSYLDRKKKEERTCQAEEGTGAKSARKIDNWGARAAVEAATKCAKRWLLLATISDDAHGSELAKIQERMLRVKDSMEIEGPHGEQLAMVKKALVTPVRERWVVKIKGGPDLEVKGNILDHEYSIGEGRDKVAEVSKKWFRERDSYGVAIDPGQDDVIILAVAVCIDEMAHEGR